MRRTLEFTTISTCPVRCSFCPQDKLIAAQGATLSGAPKASLTIDNFERMLDKVPRDVEIHFSGFAEPFLNTGTPYMICEAKLRRFEVHLYTTLIGFTDNAALMLPRHAPAYVRIHVPDTKAMPLNPAMWIRKHLLWVGTGIPSTYMTMGELPLEIVEHFAELNAFLPADVPKLKVETPDMLSRGGNLWTPTDKPIKGRVECGADRWHSNVVLPDGRVFLCCHDYGLTCPLGNLLEEPYDFIYRRAEEMRLAETPENSICRTCEWGRPFTVDTVTKSGENLANDETIS